MGVVYLAHDPQLDRLVAVKVPLFRENSGDPSVRFLREARAAAALSHPNLCPVHDVGEHNGVPYLTMAFIDGQPLSRLIEPGRPLPPEQAAEIARSIALGLQEAHDHGVIHRDLKPANVMINRKGQPVVMDFGLARRPLAAGEERLTHSGTVMGTPAYMSPEQVDGDRQAVGPCSDIYALGVILYEMLTGRLPFDGSLGALHGPDSARPAGAALSILRRAVTASGSRLPEGPGEEARRPACVHERLRGGAGRSSGFARGSSTADGPSRGGRPGSHPAQDPHGEGQAGQRGRRADWLWRVPLATGADGRRAVAGGRHGQELVCAMRE